MSWKKKLNKETATKMKKMSIIPKLTIISLMVGLIFSVFIFKFTYHHQKSLWEKEFINQAEIANLTLKNKLDVNERVLLDILSFYGASQNVDRDEFKAFVTPIFERNNFIQALEWIPRVSDNQRVKFEKLAKKDGFPSFQITERRKQGVMVRAGSRPDYYPVFYLEPITGNEAAHGFDLASNPTRFQSIKEARDSGKILASIKIRLVQGEKELSGVLIFAPFYGNSGVPKTIEERREQLTGFILGVYRLEDMFNKIISPFLPKGMHLSVFEGQEISDQNNIFGNYKVDSLFEVKNELNFSGQIWTIVLQADANFRNGVNTNMPFTSAGATFFLILFISIILELNLSQQRKTENEVRVKTHGLLASEARIKAVVDHAIDGIITIDAKGGIESFNPAAERLFGYKPSEVLGTNVKLLMPKPYQSEHDQYIKNYLESGVKKIIGIRREAIGLRKDGTTFPLELGISEIYQGETRMFTGIVRDITEQKRNENERKRAAAILELTKKELENNREQLRATLDGIAEAIITIDEQGFIRSINPAVEQIFQYPPSFLVGTNIKMLMPEPYQSEHDQYIKNYLESGVKKIIGIRREAIGLRKDGTTFPLELGISEIYLGETRMFTGIIRDITLQKEAEEKLEEANHKIQLILNSAGEGIYGLDLEGNTTFANPKAERILGYKEKELLGKLQHALIHHSKPDGTPYHRKDCHIYRSFSDGKVHRESEEVFWRKDGSPVPIEYVCTPIKENGQVTGAVVTFRDISERKRIDRMVNDHTQDLKRANEMLFNSNKELDDFAYIVSHDLKEPLRGIYNYSTFLKEDYIDKLDDDGKSKLETLERLSKRMEALINSILYFARLGRDEDILMPVDVNEILVGTLENMESLIQESQVDVRIAKNFPSVLGNESRIGEVFQNLIANAIKYNDKQDKWVEIGFTLAGNNPDGGMPPDSEKPLEKYSSSPVFYVKDNGIGILEKHFDSLFRIFKRLNGKNKFSDGTGAGTTIVKKIIEQHNGRIWIESKVGEGTTFYFTLGGEIRNEKYQP